jgi:PiT family inorganic phosphate transporter
MGEDFLFWAAIVVGVYMAWTIGANDVANAMGTSVGSGALTFRRAIVVAGVCELAGAVLVGGHVTDTVRKGIVDPASFAGEPMTLAVGMFSALLAAAIWLHLATWRGWPVSTTHSIVGAVTGFGVAAVGWDAVNGGTLAMVVSSWVVSPLVGGLISLAVFLVIRNRILETDTPLASMKRFGPILVVPVFTVLVLSLVYKGLKNLHLDLPFVQALGIGIAVGFLAAGVVWLLLRGLTVPEDATPRDELKVVEKAFVYLQIMTACFVAFAHGSNDVANAIGPMAAVVGTLEAGTVQAQVALPWWVLWAGGVGIVVGLATYGYKVIQTIGKKITEMTPSRGFTAEFGAATTILIGSKLGLPISTTHTLVGAVIGVGMARGMAALDIGVLRGIAASWVITVPFAGLISAVLYVIAAAVMGIL